MGKVVVVVLIAAVVVAVAIGAAVIALRQAAHRRRQVQDKQRRSAYERWLDTRATDEDRQRALAQLADAYAVGQLTHDEHDKRTADVLAAVTNRHVQSCLRDLGTAGQQ
ncbi:DUF1707 domain-containing protein [Planobispora siamensis]|uniref:DUF1707 domain-containing protein n=1 Tax=Planobispora siamensis TaxID=936338 RepID=A0A8J3SLC3_9ACTN|nr:DUF1707 domain-containing protein [Planobispora siamensis]GIH95369.1 hypothetical protein Psi01_59990 [Planobispora siamensis]